MTTPQKLRAPGDPGKKLQVAILGATGSIGRQALDVIDRHPDRFEVFGLVAGRRAPERRARYLVQAGDPDAEARIAELVTHRCKRWKLARKLPWRPKRCL